MNKNINFIKKLILALLPALVLIAFTALMPMCYMDEEYPAWKYTENVINGNASDLPNEESVHTLILGDSRAMADLLPEKFENSCINLAVGGGTPIEMYYFYSRYIKKHDVPETVVVMFAPFHYSYIDNFKNRTTYFNVLTLPEKAELKKNAKMCGTDSVLFDDYVAYNLSCTLRLPDVYLPAMLNSRFVGRLNVNKALYADLEKSHGQGYFGMEDGNNDRASEAGYTEMSSDGDGKLIKLYMEKLLQILDESGTQVILAQPPMNECTYDSLDENYVEEYENYINELCSGYENMIYSAEMIRYDSECFGDPSHLNEKGANMFSVEFFTKYSEFL